ncbi:MAG: hypothetical protein ACOY94_16365 [Bacillota bacterium]
MQHDWLLGLPRATWAEQEAWIAERFAADPAATAISDEEAEGFFAVTYLLRFMAPEMRARMWRAFGVKVSGSGPKAIRMGVIAILRKWKEPKLRQLLLRLIPNCGFPKWPDPAMNPKVWTDEMFQKAFDEQVNIVWLVQVRRHLGEIGDLSEWLNSVAPDAERVYWFWLNVSRLTLRRIVYPQEVPNNSVAAAVQVDAEELRARNQQTGALRQDLRRLEQDRKQLRAKAHRAEQRAKEILSQARGEVAAARRALKERRTAHEQELAAQARRFEQEIKVEHIRLAGAREQYLRELAEITPGRGWKLLRGRSIAVSDCPEGTEEAYRALIESLGGRFVIEGGNVTYSAARGLPALEHDLRNLALQKVVIRCDGLYRRKEGRHGIAVAGLHVDAGGEIIYEDARVVSCGPLAGSLMAEYGAVLMALRWLLSACPPPGAKITIWSDCRALLGRLRKERGVRRKPGCVTLDTTLRRAVRQLRTRGCEVQFRWVPRDEVHVVDRLCDRTYRELTWYHRRGSRPRASLRAFLQSGKQIG